MFLYCFINNSNLNYLFINFWLFHRFSIYDMLLNSISDNLVESLNIILHLKRLLSFPLAIHCFIFQYVFYISYYKLRAFINFNVRINRLPVNNLHKAVWCMHISLKKSYSISFFMNIPRREIKYPLFNF